MRHHLKRAFASVAVLGVILTSSVAAQAYNHNYGVGQTVLAGNPDLPRHELQSDPSQGRTLMLNMPVPNTHGRQCSGALVGPDLVLTAAHCLEGHDPDQFVRGWPGAHHEDGLLVAADDCNLRVLHTEGAGGRFQHADWALLQAVACTGGTSQIGLAHGWYDLQVGGTQAHEQLTALGYPGSEQLGTLWESPGTSLGHCLILCASHQDRAALRISQGNSGGPVLRGNATSDTLVGVVGAVEFRGDALFQRITPDMLALIDEHTAPEQ